MTNDVKDATRLYEEFHRYEPTKIGEFEPGFKIPEFVYKQGQAIDVLYRSLKTDPETLKRPRKPVDYIHDHDSKGVMVYLTDHGASVEANDRISLDERVATPAWIRDAQALTFLGQFLGLKFEGANGEPVNAKGTAPLPELYTVQTGSWSPRAALLVVQSKREVIAIVWGGKLRVEPRGIVG